MITYIRSQPPHEASASSLARSIASCVGEIVSRPCSAYHAARPGSATRTTTRGTLNLRCATCELTRFVWSPLVHARNTSARSIPASIRPSISSAVLTVKRPPASSHVVGGSLSSRSCESGSVSSTEPSCPASIARFATAEPTRPQPTIRMCTKWTLVTRTSGSHVQASHRFTERPPTRDGCPGPRDRHCDQPLAVGCHKLIGAREPLGVKPQSRDLLRRSSHLSGEELLRGFFCSSFEPEVRLRRRVDIRDDADSAARDPQLALRHRVPAGGGCHGDLLGRD